jgi:hypothetical protein
VGGEVVGQGGELGGVAAEAFHLVDGEDDPAVRGVGLDLPSQSQGGLELRADQHPGADLLGEDLIPADAVGGEGVELRLQFLRQGAAPRVSDPDVRRGGVRGEWRRRRGAGPPGLARATVGRGGHAQHLGEPGNLGEPSGVLGPGDRAGARTAR